MVTNRHLGLLGLVFALLVVGSSGYASGREARGVTQTLREPVLISGEDVGFRMMGRRGDHVFGQMVARVDGKWVPIDTRVPPSLIPADK